jgi:hypothetical protein
VSSIGRETRDTYMCNSQWTGIMVQDTSGLGLLLRLSIVVDLWVAMGSVIPRGVGGEERERLHTRWAGICRSSICTTRQTSHFTSRWCVYQTRVFSPFFFFFFLFFFFHNCFCFALFFRRPAWPYFARPITRLKTFLRRLPPIPSDPSIEDRPQRMDQIPISS